MAYQHIKIPDTGDKITIADGKPNVPAHPVVPFIEGDGTGRDIWRASVRVLNAAVAPDRVDGSVRRREMLQSVRVVAVG
jgi:isocitrate dehydrogenase